jgi:hypothetical protein
MKFLSDHPTLLRFRPAVARSTLFLITAVVWTVAGGILCVRAAGWLMSLPGSNGIIVALLAAGIAVAGHHYGLSRVALRNSLRILGLPDRVCLFAFQPWRSYFVIALMIGMGIVVRGLGPPLPILSLVYGGMGGTLLLTSTVYYRKYRHATTDIRK